MHLSHTCLRFAAEYALLYLEKSLCIFTMWLVISKRGPNSACDVGLPLELTSGLGRDRGESGGFGGVLVAPARRREKLGRLFIGIVGSGCTRSRIMRLGLVRVRTVDIKGTGGITG